VLAAGEIDGLLTVARGADEFRPDRVSDENAESVPKHRMVVGDEHADRRRVVT
jgi:hypothetical protein